MLSLKSKPVLSFLLISIVTYLIFFGRNLNPDLTIYSGKDSINFSYPTMFYLHEKLSQREFPFWTERIFSGYPIYAQFESGYLNPINIISIFLFGPILANKLIHFGFYLAGSYGLFLLIRKRNESILGFLLANLVYFFSFLILYHQQHFSITKTLFIFPLLIYFTHKAFAERKLKYVFCSVITLISVLYFGSFQAVLIVLIGQFLYLLSLKPKKTFVLKYFAIYGLFSIFLSLPLIAPAMELIKESSRNEVSYIEGSFNTLDLANFVYPFTYGSGDNYFGTSLFNDHVKHETYVYFGISVLIIAFASYKAATDETKRFVSYILIATLLLSFVRYIPLLNKFLLPPFSMFRYWGRFAALLPFASALLVSSAITKNKFDFLSLKQLKVPFFLIALTLVTWLPQAEIKQILYILKSNFVLDAHFFAWLALAVSTFAVLKLKTNKRIKLLAILVCFDLIYFGLIVTKNDFIKVSSLREEIYVEENIRTQVTDSTHNYNKGLYYKDWGYLGYTPLAPKKYVKHLQGLGFQSEKLATSDADLSKYNSLIPDGNIYSVSVIEQNEGYIRANISMFEEGNLKTNIRKYKDWKVYDNGVPIEYVGDMFIDIPLTSGDHKIELKFVPTTLYNAMVASALLTTAGALFLYLNKNARSL